MVAPVPLCERDRLVGVAVGVDRDAAVMAAHAEQRDAAHLHAVLDRLRGLGAGGRSAGTVPVHAVDEVAGELMVPQRQVVVGVRRLRSGAARGAEVGGTQAIGVVGRVAEDADAVERRGAAAHVGRDGDVAHAVVGGAEIVHGAVDARAGRRRRGIVGADGGGEREPEDEGQQDGCDLSHGASSSFVGSHDVSRFRIVEEEGRRPEPPAALGSFSWSPGS